jgi:hypothetical protein
VKKLTSKFDNKVGREIITMVGPFNKEGWNKDPEKGIIITEKGIIITM